MIKTIYDVLPYLARFEMAAFLAILAIVFIFALVWLI